MYISPFNGKVWGDFTGQNSKAHYFIEISFQKVEETVKIEYINKPPFFIDPPSSEIKFSTNTWIDEYKFPSIADPEEDFPIELMIENLPSYISFDSSSQTLNFNNEFETKEESSFSHTLKYKLKDNAGTTSEVMFLDVIITKEEKSFLSFETLKKK